MLLAVDTRRNGNLRLWPMLWMRQMTSRRRPRLTNTCGPATVVTACSSAHHPLPHLPLASFCHRGIAHRSSFREDDALAAILDPSAVHVMRNCAIADEQEHKRFNQTKCRQDFDTALRRCSKPSRPEPIQDATNGFMVYGLGLRVQD